MTKSKYLFRLTRSNSYCSDIKDTSCTDGQYRVYAPLLKKYMFVNSSGKVSGTYNSESNTSFWTIEPYGTTGKRASLFTFQYDEEDVFSSDRLSSAFMNGFNRVGYSSYFF